MTVNLHVHEHRNMVILNIRIIFSIICKKRFKHKMEDLIWIESSKSRIKEKKQRNHTRESQILRTCVTADSPRTGRISSICPNTIPGKTLMTAESRENIWLRVTKTLVVRAHSISSLMLISFVIVFSCHE
jgi:hypothetical protein